MGYTHFWEIKKPFKKTIFERYLKDIKALAILIVGKYEIPLGGPVVGKDYVQINGYGDDSYETFYITIDDIGFGSCKTMHKPYDLFVVAALWLLEHYFPDSVEFSSDGEKDELEDGKKVMEEILALKKIIR